MIVLVKPSPPPVTELDSGALEKLKVNISCTCILNLSLIEIYIYRVISCFIEKSLTVNFQMFIFSHIKFILMLN